MPSEIQQTLDMGDVGFVADQDRQSHRLGDIGRAGKFVAVLKGRDDLVEQVRAALLRNRQGLVGEVDLQAMDLEQITDRRIAREAAPRHLVRRQALGALHREGLAAAEPRAIGPARVAGRPVRAARRESPPTNRIEFVPPPARADRAWPGIRESCGAYSRSTELKAPPMRASKAARLLLASIGQDAVGRGWNSRSGVARSAWLRGVTLAQRGYMPNSRAAPVSRER